MPDQEGARRRLKGACRRASGLSADPTLVVWPRRFREWWSASISRPSRTAEACGLGVNVNPERPIGSLANAKGFIPGLPIAYRFIMVNRSLKRDFFLTGLDKCDRRGEGGYLTLAGMRAVTQARLAAGCLYARPRGGELNEALAYWSGFCQLTTARAYRPAATRRQIPPADLTIGRRKGRGLGRRRLKAEGQRSREVSQSIPVSNRGGWPPRGIRNCMASSWRRRKKLRSRALVAGSSERRIAKLPGSC